MIGGGGLTGATVVGYTGFNTVGVIGAATGFTTY